MVYSGIGATLVTQRHMTKSKKITKPKLIKGDMGHAKDPISPGERLKNELKERGWNWCCFAKKAECDKSDIEALIIEKKPLTKQLAEKIAKVLGTSVHYWLRCEKNYRRHPKLSLDKKSCR